MNFFEKFSIKSKLLLLVLGALIPMFIGGFISSSKLAYYSEELLMDSYAHNAKALNSAIAAQFFERYGDVQAFAVNQAVISMNEENMSGYLDEYVSLYGIYDLILVVDKKGNFVASNSKDFFGKSIKKDILRSKNFSEETWFKSAMANKFTEDSKKDLKGTFVEDFIIDQVQQLALGERRLGSSFTTVIRNKEGDIIGVITNRAGSRWFESEILKLYKNLKVQGLKSSEITVFNKNGIVISNFDPSTNGAEDFYEFNNNAIFNLTSSDFGNEIKNILANQKSGSILTENPQKKIKQIVGYSFNDDSKFISDIGWSTVLRESKDVALQGQTKIIRSTYLIFAIISFFSLGLAFLFSNYLSSSIFQITGKVSISSEKVSMASRELSRSSKELSEASQSQASAILESSASIDEITKIIEANVDSSEGANHKAVDIQRSATETQIAVAELTEAMSNILDSNNKISELVSIIEEIGVKTEIIDEIVFNTQLLSFNASVEAERAGESGRGFAVVAQEVGNLAKLSGKSAAEISNIVKTSIKHAEMVAADNKERVDKGGVLVAKTKEKMNEVLKNINEIYFSTEQIAHASRDQSIGMAEISTNVQNISMITARTASIAEVAANSSTELDSQSEQLLMLVKQLQKLVAGVRKSG